VLAHPGPAYCLAGAGCSAVFLGSASSQPPEQFLERIHRQRQRQHGQQRGQRAVATERVCDGTTQSSLTPVWHVTRVPVSASCAPSLFGLRRRRAFPQTQSPRGTHQGGQRLDRHLGHGVALFGGALQGGAGEGGQPADDGSRQRLDIAPSSEDAPLRWSGPPAYFAASSFFAVSAPALAASAFVASPIGPISILTEWIFPVNVLSPFL